MKTKSTLTTGALLILTAAMAAAGPATSSRTSREPVKTRQAPVSTYKETPAFRPAPVSSHKGAPAFRQPTVWGRQSPAPVASHGRDGRPDHGRSWNSRIEVKAQVRLKQLGYYYGRIDGEFGRGSRSALMRFQRHAGLHQTGVLDSRTVRALRIFG